MRLSLKDTAVSGNGTYTTGAHRTGKLTVAGFYRDASANLTLSYDHGEVVSFSSTRVGADRMPGRLVYKSGSVMQIEFVRP